MALKKLIMLILAVSLLPVSAVKAALNEASQQGAAVVVKGNIEKEKKGVFVTLVVTKSGVSAEDINNAFDDNVYYVDQTESDENGDYYFNVYLPSDMAAHEIYVKAGEGKYRTADKDNVRYTAVSLICEAMENVNKAYYENSSEEARKTAMLAAIESEYLALFDLTQYEDYSNLKDKSITAEYMLNSIAKSKLTYASDEEMNSSMQRFVSDWKKAVGINAIYESENQEKMKELFNDYSEILGVDVTRLNSLKSEKEYFLEEFKRQAPKTTEELYQAYNASCAFSDANNVLSWSVLKDIFTKDSQNLGIDMGESSRYGQIKDKDSFFKNFVKYVPFNSLENLREVFNASVEQYIKEENSKPNSNTSGGGGGGGGGNSGGGSSSGQNLGGAIGPAAPVIVDKNGNVNDNDNVYTEKKSFKDIENVQWAKESIEALCEMGIVNGVDDENFEPQRNITRAEFLKMIIMAFEVKTGSLTDDFNDVSPDDWYYDYVIAGKNAGIVTGDENGNFNPNSNISRQDMSAMLYRCMLESGYSFDDSAKAFNDDESINDYAHDAVSKLSGSGIVNGYDDNTFRPFGLATRAEAAKMIYGGMMKGK